MNRTTTAQPALIAAINDVDPNVQYHAIEALGKLKVTDAVDALADLAESKGFFLGFVALTLEKDWRSARRATNGSALEDDFLRHRAINVLGQL